MSEQAAAEAKVEKKARKAKPKAEKPADRPPVSKPRMRILRALAKAKNGLSKAQVAEKAGVPLTWVNEHALRAGKATEGTQALCEQGLARVDERELDGGVKERWFTITAKGQKLAERFPA